MRKRQLLELIFFATLCRYDFVPNARRAVDMKLRIEPVRDESWLLFCRECSSLTDESREILLSLLALLKKECIERCNKLENPDGELADFIKGLGFVSTTVAREKVAGLLTRYLQDFSDTLLRETREKILFLLHGAGGKPLVDVSQKLLAAEFPAVQTDFHDSDKFDRRDVFVPGGVIAPNVYMELFRCIQSLCGCTSREKWKNYIDMALRETHHQLVLIFDGLFAILEYAISCKDV